MSTNAEAYSDDLRNTAKVIVEERASRRSNKTTVSTAETYKEAAGTAAAMKAKKPVKKAAAPKTDPTPKADPVADADDKS